NTMFQGLAADGAKEALWQVARRCYERRYRGNALHGSRPILFLHDELILEVPEDRAPEAADELARVMVESMRLWVRDVPIKAEPRLMDRWRKDAKEVRGADG